MAAKVQQEGIDSPATPMLALEGEGAPVVRRRQPISVGRMRIELTESVTESPVTGASKTGQPAAKAIRKVEATLHLNTGDIPVRLDGLIIKEPRPGWVTIEVPPLEAWEEPTRWLTPEQKERLSDPSFFQFLQTELTRRYLRMTR